MLKVNILKYGGLREEEGEAALVEIQMDFVNPASFFG